MPSKKEPLSLIVVKTLLAVIIFAGVGTIIFAGGWLVGKHNKVSEPVKKDVVIDNNKDNNKAEDETAIKEKTSDETADRKTYRSEKYGFEMKCPEGCPKGLSVSDGLYRANSTNSPLNITYKCDGPLRNLENVRYEYCETNKKDYLTQYEFSDLTTSGFETGGGTVWRWYKLYIKKIKGVDFVFQGYLDDNLNWSNTDNWIDGPYFYSKEDKEKYKRLSTKKYLDGILTDESVIDKINKWDKFVESL